MHTIAIKYEGLVHFIFRQYRLDKNILNIFIAFKISSKVYYYMYTLLKRRLVSEVAAIKY
jgi:hypothetical protein